MMGMVMVSEEALSLLFRHAIKQTTETECFCTICRSPVFVRSYYLPEGSPIIKWCDSCSCGHFKETVWADHN